MRKVLRTGHWIAKEQLGVDARRLALWPIGLARYVRDLFRFAIQRPEKLRLMPCLHDWWEQAGSVESEYFWQDLLVARLIFEERPETHVDVGSRLDGFVAHVAAFRPIEVFDVRPLTTEIPGVKFRRVDFMQPDNVPIAYADSVSCLHAIEHFGLGRYGDPIMTDGVSRGLSNLARIVSGGGKLYLSCPIGDDVVKFNAHRCLRPNTVTALAAKHGLALQRLWLYRTVDRTLQEWSTQANQVASVDLCGYSLAIYVFRKVN